MLSSRSVGSKSLWCFQWRMNPQLLWIWQHNTLLLPYTEKKKRFYGQIWTLLSQSVCSPNKQQVLTVCISPHSQGRHIEVYDMELIHHSPWTVCPLPPPHKSETVDESSVFQIINAPLWIDTKLTNQAYAFPVQRPTQYYLYGPRLQAQESHSQWHNMLYTWCIHNLKSYKPAQITLRWYCVSVLCTILTPLSSWEYHACMHGCKRPVCHILYFSRIFDQSQFRPSILKRAQQ